MKISIIIPVYNVEEYISKCLDSIFNQSLDKNFYEVIVVNDGSIDGSMKIVNEFSKRFFNLHIIEQKNAGVSSARNLGIEHTEGDYITFIDADDWIVQGSLVKAYAYLELNASIDVLLFKSNSENGVEFYPWIDKCENNYLYSGVEVFKLGFRRGSVCGGFYRRLFLQENSINFPIGVRNGEDSITMSLVLTYAQTICFQPYPYYVVYERSGSASRVFTVEHLQLMNKTLNAIQMIIYKKSSSLSVEQNDILTEMFYSQISDLTYTSIAVGRMKLKTIKDNIPLKQYLPIHYKKGNKKGWKLILLNISYNLFYWSIRMKLRMLCFNR